MRVTTVPYREIFNKYISPGHRARQCITPKNKISISSLVLYLSNRPLRASTPVLVDNGYELNSSLQARGVYYILMDIVGIRTLFAKYSVYLSQDSPRANGGHRKTVFHLASNPAKD